MASLVRFLHWLHCDVLNICVYVAPGHVFVNICLEHGCHVSNFRNLIATDHVRIFFGCVEFSHAWKGMDCTYL
jgi:hypothetical protein